MALLPGARIDDFEIIRLLGRGAFGHVYLARQLSLDRQVALKVSANRGSEGRTMARLEHQHIVQVFSEKVEPDFNQRLLCMQLVPGVGLEKIIGALHPKDVARAPDSTWTGSDLLAVIDRSPALPSALDPLALRDREALSQMDDVQATAWIGERLADALDFAHRHGVLHRDIKPANILVDPYGRPMLADFNISSQPVGGESDGEEMFGGTFAYMAPEHLDAFNPSDSTGPDAVTARSDIYSLGLVMNQLLAGRLPVPLPDRKENMADTLRAASAVRRRSRPACQSGLPSARKTLARTIGRCIEPCPEDRFASGAELGEQLEGCRQLRGAERRMPRPRAPFESVLRRPFLWLISLVVVPQLMASAINISYNATQIKLEPNQQSLFNQLVIGYNALVYPIAFAVFGLAIWPVWHAWRALSSSAAVPAEQVAQGRKAALRLPVWIATLTAWGWFPGGFLFPLVIHLATPQGLSAHVAAHFVASFFMSGLIALAYSLCGAQYVVLRALYPVMWTDVRGFVATARGELGPMAGRSWQMHVLAGLIPLFGAIVAVFLAPAGDQLAFRSIVVGLIVLGIFGYQVTSTITRRLSEVVVKFTSGEA